MAITKTIALPAGYTLSAADISGSHIEDGVFLLVSTRDGIQYRIKCLTADEAWEMQDTLTLWVNEHRPIFPLRGEYFC